MDNLSPLLGRTLVLVAHPDDEAVGCGVLLQRMREPLVVFATDGGPRDEYFWKQYGSREAYSEMRRCEARNSLAQAGVTQIEFLRGAQGFFTDQELCRWLPNAEAAVAHIIEGTRPEALLTLAYEGGHPDHDSCSLLTAVLARRFGLPAWEFPLYFRHENGDPLFQHFRKINGSEISIQPTAAEVETKHRMLAAYASQGEMLKNFSAAQEWFRPQPAYDYGQKPHEGVLNYEAWGWPIRGVDVCRQFTEFLRSREDAGALNRS